MDKRIGKGLGQAQLALQNDKATEQSKTERDAASDQPSPAARASRMPDALRTLAEGKSFTSAGLAHLAKMNAIQSLNLALNRQFTEAGIAQLHALGSLQIRR